MPVEMIGSLITSQTRIKLLKKFFLNSSIRAHLRGLEAELGESSNSIRIELNRLEKAGLLSSSRDRNKKLYQANTNHPLFSDIHNIIIKEMGIDKLVDKIISRIGLVNSIYITGDFALGRDGPVIDILIVGKDINRDYLSRKIYKAEEIIPRKIRYTIIDPGEADDFLTKIPEISVFPIWEDDIGKKN